MSVFLEGKMVNSTRIEILTTLLEKGASPEKVLELAKEIAAFVEEEHDILRYIDNDLDEFFVDEEQINPIPEKDPYCPICGNDILIHVYNSEDLFSLMCGRCDLMLRSSEGEEALVAKWNRMNA